MVEIPINDVGIHLAELVLRASRGETILITARGRPLAKLGPVDAAPVKTSDYDRTIAALRDIRSRSKLVEGESLGDLL